MHERGLAHGDVKLENVLVAIHGEHATAHLADFESARQQRIDGTRTITQLSTTASSGLKYTELYVAPEILTVPNSKPTAAADMFSYGVCCLFACCLPAEEAQQAEDFAQFHADGRALKEWSRGRVQSADLHLLPLLESLLAPASTHQEALDRRLNAKQTLCHPFLDTFEAIELAQREAEALELARQAQERESEEERQRLHLEAEAQQQAIANERRRHRQHMRQKEQEMAADAERQHAALRAERRANEQVAQELQAKRQRLWRSRRTRWLRQWPMRGSSRSG